MSFKALWHSDVSLSLFLLCMLLVLVALFLFGFCVVFLFVFFRVFFVCVCVCVCMCVCFILLLLFYFTLAIGCDNTPVDSWLYRCTCGRLGWTVGQLTTTYSGVCVLTPGRPIVPRPVSTRRGPAGRREPGQTERRREAMPNTTSSIMCGI